VGESNNAEVEGKQTKLRIHVARTLRVAKS
jgi:hypothetical protein